MPHAPAPFASTECTHKTASRWKMTRGGRLAPFTPSAELASGISYLATETRQGQWEFCSLHRLLGRDNGGRLADECDSNLSDTVKNMFAEAYARLSRGRN